jgi:hypothetical protein
MIGGNQMLAQQQFGQGLATQNLSNYLTRLSGMSGQGITAAGTVAGANTAGAKYTGDDIMARGTANASGMLGMYNGLKGGFSELQKGLSQSSYGGSPSYGGNGEWGGSSAYPLAGLSPSDYGPGF